MSVTAKMVAPSAAKRHPAQKTYCVDTFLRSQFAAIPPMKPPVLPALSVTDPSSRLRGTLRWGKLALTDGLRQVAQHDLDCVKTMHVEVVDARQIVPDSDNEEDRGGSQLGPRTRKIGHAASLPEQRPRTRSS